jgi:hypothetical protein
MTRDLLLTGIAISIIYVVLATLLYQLQSLLLAVFIFGLLILFLRYRLPEVPKSTNQYLNALSIDYHFPLFIVDS